MRGQAEFIVVFAIIAVAVVAVIIAMQPSGIIPQPPITEELKTVKDSVTNLMKTGLREQLDLVYNQGGVVESPGNSVDYGSMKVKVWQGCGEVDMPNVKKEISDGLSSYIAGNLKSQEEFFGKTVNFDFSRFTITILVQGNIVTARVDLPTDVEGQALPQPYEFSIPSDLAEILDFSSNFASEMEDSRFFEKITLKTMTETDPESDEWIPMPGAKLDCGQVIVKRKSDIVPGMKKVVYYVVKHVIWNTNPIYIEGNDFYNLNTAGGKQYPDLKVNFEYPRSWDENFEDNFVVFPDPIQANPVQPIPAAPLCFAPIIAHYSIKYPIIVHVEDPVNGEIFHFAMMVSIVNNEEGSCELPGSISPEYSELCEQDLGCHATISVKDTEGNPIEGADVTFSICSLGRTGADGSLEADIPCMGSEFDVYKQGYKSYGALLNSADLEDLTVSLEKYQETVTFHIAALPMIPVGESSVGDNVAFAEYNITEQVPISGMQGITIIPHIEPKNANPLVPEDQPVYLNLLDANGNVQDVLDVEGVYPNDVVLSILVTNDANSDYIGYAGQEFTITSDMTDLYLYVPVVMDLAWKPPAAYEYLSGILDEGEEARISQGMTSCGIDPISSQPQELSGKSWCMIQ